MLVNLINPPQPELFDADSYPSLGLLYLAGVLEAAGHEYRYIRSDEALSRDIPCADAHLVTATTATRREALGLGAWLAEHRPELRVIGGVDPTIEPHHYAGSFDAVVRGEAERVITDVVDGQRVGIVEAGILKDHAHTALDRALDFAPIPPREQVRADMSGTVASGREGVPATTVCTSRGCPYSCAFCSRIAMTKTVRYHSVERVAAEFSYLWGLGFRFLRVVDDMFALWEPRVLDLCKALIRKRDFFRWLCITRADRLTEKMAAAMSEAGCEEVCFGVETGSAALMRAMKKAETPEDIARGTRIAKAAGIQVKMFLIAGLPGETADDVEQTKRFLLETRPDKWTVSDFTPLPGSELWQPCYNDAPGRGYFYRDQEPELKRWLRADYPAMVGKERAA